MVLDNFTKRNINLLSLINYISCAFGANDGSVPGVRSKRQYLTDDFLSGKRISNIAFFAIQHPELYRKLKNQTNFSFCDGPEHRKMTLSKLMQAALANYEKLGEKLNFANVSKI
jgi:hypothetical protein